MIKSKHQSDFVAGAESKDLQSQDDSHSGDYTEDFSVVLSAEQSWRERRREAVGVDDSAPSVGVALSGGGIRSATFNLGVLNELDRQGLMKQVDYLSTVSGGGYIGACYSWLINRRASAKHADTQAPLFDTPVKGEHTDVLGWLRAHGKYLISEPGFSGWTLGASILASIGLNLLVFLPVILLVFAAMSYDFSLVSWPALATLPGTDVTVGHDGFTLVLIASVICFFAYAVLMLKYAIVSGITRLRSTHNVLRIRRWMGTALQLGVVFALVGLIPALALLDEAFIARAQSAFMQNFGSHATYLTPLIAGALASWRSIRTANSGNGSTGKLAIAGLGLLIYGAAMFAYHLVMHTALVSSTGFFLIVALSLGLGLFCDPNWVSMHSYYRARIASAFMPHVALDGATGDERSLDYRMHQMTPESGAPLHIINTTMNTMTSPLYKWRSREGGSFSFTALFSGSPLTGYRRTQTYLDGGVALSTAVTVSGAAVDPNNSLVKSRAVSALMSLLNCRLGFWAENPTIKGKRRFGADWFSLVGREVLGVGLSETGSHVHLSDGGQFDNLGVYELVRRQCRYIVASDAGADPSYSLSDLGRVINLVKADFGAHIDISAEALLEHQSSQSGFCPFALGTIHYADGSKGELLYLKSMTFESLPANVYSYAHQNPQFPNESTANQFYGESQFDAYETLGRTIVKRWLGEQKEEGIAVAFQRARELIESSGNTVNKLSMDTASSKGEREFKDRRRPGSPLRSKSEGRIDVSRDLDDSEENIASA